MKTTKTTLLAAVIHELAKAETFTTWTDLCEIIKLRCATLKIPYNSGLITEAVALVNRTRPVLVERRRSTRIELAAPERPIGRDEAAAICRRLQVAGHDISERAKP